MVQWLALLLWVQTCRPAGAFLCEVHVLSVSVWVSSVCPGLLPVSNDMHVRVIGDSKSPVAVNVCMKTCLSPRAVYWQESGHMMRVTTQGLRVNILQYIAIL